jgi:hypothetical protein
MKLETADRISSADATEEELLNAFANDADRGEFIILSQSDQVYIQASGESDGPYVMEYREGDADHHFQCTQDLSKETVQATFMKYLRGDNSWKTNVDWKQLGNKPWWKVW